jgi:hypothetical protein
MKLLIMQFSAVSCYFLSLRNFLIIVQNISLCSDLAFELSKGPTLKYEHLCEAALYQKHNHLHYKEA